MALKLPVCVLFCCFTLFALLPLISVAQKTTTQAPSNTNGDTPTGRRKVTEMKVAVMLQEPYVMLKGSSYEGMFIDILKELKRRANLSYTITTHGDHEGVEYAPGNWTGLIGSVQTGEVDLAVAPLSILSKQQQVVDFTFPVMSAGLRILYKVPSPWSGGEAFGILLSPFTPGLWIMLLLIFTGVSLLFYVIGRFSPYEDTAFVGKAATYEGLTLINSFLYSFSSMTFQGYTAAPRSLAGRFLAAFWWVFVLLVVAAYSASLCAVFLAFKPSIRSLPFATFDELSKQSSVAYGVVRGGSTQGYLNSSRRPVQSRLWGTISANADNVLVNSVQEGMLRVLKSRGDFAFIMEGPMAEYLSEQPPCELMTVGEELGEHAYGFACNKETDVCDNLNRYILQLQEEDYVFEMKRKWLHKGCLRGDTATYLFHGLAYFDTFGADPNSAPYLADRSVTLRRFSTGFLLLLIGGVLSGLILIGEIFYSRRRGTAVPRRMPRGMEDQERIDREFRDEADA
ncbi:glutamate receptor 2-like [Babylonia areolata]|uniref:glutamate receptor 2-like n=1 Tax=Babylonia areolata TaxID=304850 RepID=UPI003FD1FBFA